METTWKTSPFAAAWFCSLAAAGSAAAGLPSPRMFLMFGRFLLNRKSSTPRRETGPDGPSSDGEYPLGGEAGSTNTSRERPQASSW